MGCKVPMTVIIYCYCRKYQPYSLVHGVVAFGLIIILQFFPPKTNDEAGFSWV